ncbi:MAG: outer membrane beta-barrel protein [Flavobacterium sp.]
MQKILILITILLVQFVCSQEKPKVLEEVKIVNEVKTFTNKNGNIKIDVANSIFNSVPNTVDLLSKLPKVQISPDKESITVIGKGIPIIYIDNQIVIMNDLNSLSVDDIKTIEIINNPSSKYEANGRVVLLITRKLSKKEGFKVTVSETASFQKKFNNYFGINSSIKKKKLEFKANFNYNQIKVWEGNGNNFTIPNYDIISNYNVIAITKRPQFIFGGGLFYKINEDDYFSINANRRAQKDIFDIVTDTYNQQQTTINNINTLNANDEFRNFTNVFLNYNHKIKSIGGQLFTGFQISNFNQEIDSEIFNNFNNTNFELSQNRFQKIKINVYSARSDFEKEFKNKMKIELGVLFLKANPTTDFEVNDMNPSSDLSSNYNYEETNNAAYSNVSGTIKKVNYAIGLRVENTIAKGKNSSESNLVIDKNYTNFFPKLEIEIPIDSTNTVTFNYAKSISRPNFSTASQLSTYINPYLVWNNNININPTITDEVSLAYQFKDKSVKLSYYDIKDPVYYASSYNNSQNLLTFQTKNFEKESGFNLEFTIPFKYKFWTSNNTINGIINTIEDKVSVVNPSKPYLYFYSNNIFRLPKAIELSLTSWGITQRTEGVFERNGLITFDMAVSKTFFKNLNCTLSYNDIFRKVKFNENFSSNNITSKGVFYTDLHLVSIAMRYSFGKIKKQEFKEKEIDENSRRIR